MIRKAIESDIDMIHRLTQSCAKAMIAKGIYQWNEHYPTRSRFEKDIALGELYLLEENHMIKGIIVITPTMDEEYIPIQWLTSSDENIYIHRLAVHPEYWHNGYARKLMDFAETYAQEQNYPSVRLDTFSKNKRNHTFYENRGYQRLGNIFFPKQSEFPFYCYELVF
ncbi:GNAT family N-acetyltransferase [Aquimarina sp. ERC-38]|uniref:GNAT family N-acetyltransferase n=1 Tax=Aquimarina sp. ERC-38 TaxID=2949996 RepID=UPI002247033F|nr:GNAT family N-acetyltransferase [Aquimarina sp. ERC-38]UZO81727.1 GNAT family N-acetyltransferase [Aquimarina sp. ERC-38]